ncbi:sensor domain-containing diguanylate cyclase [Roseibium sp.]|uniref:sensor domain-containing diguanylate cyclase n=1 Tax=Roseibium sp. TaxID=1936156 RepID=UPI003D12A564
MRLLQKIFDALPATLNCKDSSGRYVMMNAFQAQQLGLSSKDAIGQTTPDLFGERWGRAVQKQDAEVLRTGKTLGPYKEDYQALGRKSGHWLTYKFPLRLSGDGSCSHVVTISFDITSLYETEQELKSAALTDALTGLRNRRWFDQCMDELDRSYTRRRRSGIGLMVADIDFFKSVNDEWGHHSGDLVLKEAAERMHKIVRTRQGDAVVRLGGEEFAIVMHDVTAEELVTVAERVRRSIGEPPFSCLPSALKITVSIGCAIMLPDEAPRHTFERADAALYEAKSAGRNRVHYSTPPENPAAHLGNAKQ